MKLLLRIIILSCLFGMSACNVHAQNGPQRTSSARAAYGNAVPEFKAHKKKNQKRVKKTRKEARQKTVRKNRSYWHARPY
jgi:hypothetical protein